jgi:hypothetical protein
MKEARTWKPKGASLTVLGRGNEEKSFEEHAGLLNLGNIFSKHFFESLERAKLYDTSILIPAGYETYLQVFTDQTGEIKIEKRKN